MTRLISICGLVCSECGAYIATQADDDVQRKKVADEWARAYQADLKPEDKLRRLHIRQRQDF
jgi:hypothetical protein